MWAMTQEYYEKHYDEDGNMKDDESGIKKTDWEKGGNIGNWERIIFDETQYYIKFKNQDDDRILLIEAIEKDSMQRYNPPKWQVSVGGSISRVLIKDYAKSKSEALKVAKTYMRSH
jgi:hypothetical protein